MKKLLASMLVSLGCSGSGAMAAGPYDGIWLVSYRGVSLDHYSLHERDGSLVLVSVPEGNTSWDAYMGPRNGTTASVTTIISGVNAQATLTFTSDDTFNFTQNSCVVVVAGWQCGIPNGTILQGRRIW